MITSELYKLGILADEFFISVYTDVDLDIPAGATITMNYYNPDPSKYIWFKIDTMYSPLMNNRVFSISAYFDSDNITEFENIEMSKCFSMSPERCLHSGMSGTSWKAVATNTSSSTQTFDALIRGILIERRHLSLIEDIFTKTIIKLDDAAILKLSRAKLNLSDESIYKITNRPLNLSDETINKLALKLGECIKPAFSPQFVKKRE